MQGTKSRKVAVVGAGQVGSTLAMRIAESGLADVAIVDVVEGMAQGKALDLSHSFALAGLSKKAVGSTDYKVIADSDVVAITAGLARKPGMTREELLEKNAKIVRAVSLRIRQLAPEAVVIVITNPLDVMSYLAQKVTCMPHEKVIGMAGVLDNARLSHYLAEALGVHPSKAEVMLIGSHGDSMVPLLDQCRVNGTCIKELLPEEKITDIFEQTRNSGATMVSLSGSAYYAPSASAVEMIDSILNDRNKIMPCSVHARGRYGLDDVYIGLPARLGAGGVTEILELELGKLEMDQLHRSADVVRKNIDVLGL